MNEYPPYLQDTGHRAMAHYNPDTQNYPRIPAWLVLDDEGRQLFPLGMPSYHQEGVSFEWSEDNKVEIEAGILHQASSLEELSQKTGIALAVLKQSIEDWNECCKNGLDEEFGRPSETMMAIKKPPFVFAELWPIVSNTQGGPVHDDKNQVLNPFGEAIPGLYAAGELGSLFGHLYLSGGNIAECFIGGKIAGENAAAES